MMASEPALRAFLARILGWANTGGIEAALQAIYLSAAYHTALVLLGDRDMVPLAMALHRRIVGADRPFILSDPRRRNAPATVRGPANQESGVAAVKAATGGSLCMRQVRLPRDRRSMAALIRGPGAAVHIIICGGTHDALHPYLLRPAPILVPPLRTRAAELGRIVDEYAVDALTALRAGAFTGADRQWVLSHAARTLPEIETATLRLAARRQAGTMNGATALLGMSHTALVEWFDSRTSGRSKP
jgi:hypothetical protein